jgi:hypothetical protein
MAACAGAARKTGKTAHLVNFISAPSTAGRQQGCASAQSGRLKLSAQTGRISLQRQQFWVIDGPG